MGHGKDTLTHVIEKEGGKHEIPGMQNRFFTQVPHIGIQGLAARGAQNDFGKDEEARQTVFRKKFECIVGIDGFQDSRHGNDGGQPRCRQANKPDQHHRSENTGDFIHPRD